jgi:hypothetical protein
MRSEARGGNSGWGNQESVIDTDGGESTGWGGQ